MTKKSKLPDLEKSLSEINTLVEQMEGGELTLDQSLGQFERGIILIKHAQAILNEAEQKVQLLINTRGEEKLTSYENNDE
jgi:exodeoxyribonuclease VII small subunit